MPARTPEVVLVIEIGRVRNHPPSVSPKVSVMFTFLCATSLLRAAPESVCEPRVSRIPPPTRGDQTCSSNKEENVPVMDPEVRAMRRMG
jgi:hypothetical protein